jgi:kynurenine formamidase
MIDAVNAVFELSFKLDLQIPVWKLFATPTFRKFMKYEDDILEYVYLHPITL